LTGTNRIGQSTRFHKYRFEGNLADIQATIHGAFALQLSLSRKMTVCLKPWTRGQTHQGSLSPIISSGTIKKSTFSLT
jgi:hypothetical protein